MTAAIICLVSAPLRADDKKPNPNYQVWAKFKPGSTCTVVADIRDGQDNIHIETTRTLISINADEAVVQTVSKAKRKGHQDTQAPIKQTIPAVIDLGKPDKEQIKETGSKDIDAMGKTFKCRVWDSTPPKAAAGSHPPKLSAAEGMKATIYISDDVPGGIVRLDGVGQNGQTVTFVLTEFETK